MKALTLRDPTLLGILGKVAAPDAANLRIWLDADDIDGMRNSTLTTGQKINSWKNKGTIGGLFLQANATLAPTFTRTSGIGSGGGGVFSLTHWVKSDAAPSAFSFMHNGTGCTMYAVANSTQDGISVIMSTTTGASMGAGIGFRRQVGAERSNMYVSNDTDIILNVTDNFGNYPINQYDLLTAIFDTNAPVITDGRLLMRGSLNGAQDVTGTPSSGPAASAAVFGATPVGDLGFQGVQWQFMAFAATHDGAMQAEVLAFMQTMAKANFPIAIAP